MKILTAQQARQVDQETCQLTGIPNLLLMESAATRLVEFIETFLRDPRGKSILVLAGKGNNGGDGLAAARQLLMRGACPQVCLLADPEQLQGDARLNFRMAVSSGVPWVQCPEGSTTATWPESWREYDLLLDGLLGTGTRGPATGLLADAIEWINRKFKGYVLAVDLPSGLEADSARLPGPVVAADATVTFTALKLCHLLQPAAQCCGQLVVSPIGTPSGLLRKEEYFLELFERSMLSPVLKPRAPEAHKGQFGRVLVLAGSRGKAGAAALAGMGALKAGAGLVTVAVPAGCQGLVAGFAPELMTEGLPETAAGGFAVSAAEPARRLAAGADVLAIGPGLGQGPETARFLDAILAAGPQPVVLDADALNLLASGQVRLPQFKDRMVVLTPHPGEMARLVDNSTQQVQLDRIATARSFAMQQRIILVLKGSGTLIASPSGSVLVNLTGNAGMATGGSGDVLTGMVAALLAQRSLLPGPPMTEPEAAAAVATAVFLHGLAGDCAAAATSQMTLVATDLLRYLPEAMNCLREEEAYFPGGSVRPRQLLKPMRGKD